MTTSVALTRPTMRREALDHVVLVDDRGRPTGTLPKAEAHHGATLLHLAFSCYVVRSDGALLLTRRAHGKRTWPGAWTNACCGHPQVGETLREAVTRRLDEELGLAPRRLGVAIADFMYQAAMVDGTTEHELCPVLIASVDREPDVDPAEVDDTEWISWESLVERVRAVPDSLSPWCVEQVRQLARSGFSPVEWLSGPPSAAVLVGLDNPIELGASPSTGIGANRLDGGYRHDVSIGPDPCAMVARRVGRILDEFVSGKVRELVSVDPRLALLAGEIGSLLGAGGKRLRPAFAYWGHRATGSAHDEAVFGPAAAIELLHTFALIHDDVMDRSMTRRGRPSAFVAMADEHREAGFVGDSGWFGVSAATLAGDLAFVWADELFESRPLEQAALDRARRVFATLRSEVIAGQYLDLTLAGDVRAVEEGASRVALLKSARYTVTRPLLLGAALAPEPLAARVEPALMTFGDAVGLAFQMRDDILGVFGDPRLTGKGCLDDLREGKRTVLALRALRLSKSSDRELLARSLGDPQLDEDAAAKCREAIARSGALASVEARIAHQHEIALAALDEIDDPARSALERLAASAIERRG